MTIYLVLLTSLAVTMGEDLMTKTPNLRSVSKTTEDSSLQPVAATGTVEGVALPTPLDSATHAFIRDKINSAASSTASFHELKVSDISASPASPSAVLEITTQACTSANVISRSTK